MCQEISDTVFVPFVPKNVSH